MIVQVSLDYLIETPFHPFFLLTPPTLFPSPTFPLSLSPSLYIPSLDTITTVAMTFRSGRPIRRYVAMLCILAVFVYYSGIHLGRNSAYISSSPDATAAAAAQDGSMEYVKPKEHEVTKQDGYMQVDHDLIKQRERQVMRRQIDQKYCGREQCRFMLPIAITEQESKAQEHFRQLAFLSGKLGRTIVLPNVHSSHLGACRHFPFSFYYSSEWLEQNKRFFNYITMEDFREWLAERQSSDTAVPTSQEVVVDINPDFHFLDKAENCFKDMLDYTGRPRTRFTLEDPEMFSKRVGDYTEILLNALSDETLNKDYIGEDTDVPPLDVISLFYDRRFGYIKEPEVLKPLTYNDRWIQLADQIANQLSPFVAIHWRMERLEPVDNMVGCAESLVKNVQAIEAEHEQPLKIFLLTDYPHLLRSSIAVPESMSFKLNELKQQHHDAVQYVYERLDVTVTTLQKENQAIPYDELPAKHWNIIPVPPYAKPPDSSVLGIVDKLVAMRAQYFLAGKPAVCGKSSSFTKRITEERKQAHEAGDPNIILPMDIFSL
ncbi:hypothetical protein BDB00DRAFT_820390 [Zychaea mexicana]|uniref:uncharacterized protein n=1 Tax=Zychaea mexicana TaxID=64656 RepID=UPI0022FDD9D3|nr:uncharacterized protein BDB00DRAFT_820390 [Zychaea mexicana]KAI9494004.1 hypothetical protein BDB00DRAFT_820390 [Zychaea mexicana]